MKTIRIVNSEIHLPIEIFVSWGQPESLVVEQGSGSVLVWVPDFRSPRDFVKRTVSSLRKSRLGLSRVDLDEQVAVFESRRVRLGDGDYMAANYHPLYELMDVASANHLTTTVDRSSVNAGFWSRVTDYHEHLPVAEQDVEAHETSKLLVSSIDSLPIKPKTILELGCGAGRNLWHVGRAFPDAEIFGIDINTAGVSSREMPSNVRIRQDNILELDWNALGRFDVIFTAGFLMHINHEDVRVLMRRIHEHSDRHLHFELHGQSSEWDYHRYPRSYRALMNELGIPYTEYQIYDERSVYSHGLTPPFAHALLSVV